MRSRKKNREEPGKKVWKGLWKEGRGNIIEEGNGEKALDK